MAMKEKDSRDWHAWSVARSLMRAAVVVTFAGTFLRHSDGKLAEAFRVGAQASRREIVAKQRHQVVSDLPCNAPRKLLGQVVGQPCALDAEVSALELGDVRVEGWARSDESAEVDCGGE